MNGGSNIPMARLLPVECRVCAQIAICGGKAICEQTRWFKSTHEKAPANRGFLRDKRLFAVEVTEQPQDLEVEPDQRHGQAEGNAP